MFLIDIINTDNEPNIIEQIIDNNKNDNNMKTLKIYYRLIIQAYTSEQISTMLLNLFIALADNDERDINSIIERYEITFEEMQQFQMLTGKLLFSYI